MRECIAGGFFSIDVRDDENGGRRFVHGQKTSFVLRHNTIYDDDSIVLRWGHARALGQRFPTEYIFIRLPGEGAAYTRRNILSVRTRHTAVSRAIFTVFTIEHRLNNREKRSRFNAGIEGR